MWANITATFGAVVALSAVLWYAAPLLAIMGYHPFESQIWRIGSMIFVAVMGGGYVIMSVVRMRRREKALTQGVSTADAEEDDTDALKDRMKDALATLKTASGGKGSYLYDLPWYVMIGPPGSGKTTALLNSGLNFPLAKGTSPAKISGVGGTRYCDWFFTEDAVLIDTAGRYTTQDSNQRADQKSWLAFLDLLKKNRPRQPINGVMIAISIRDIMSKPEQEIAADANAIRARLLELHDRLKVDFPVYVVFTMMDLVAGFIEFYGNFGEMQRRMVWGATFQSAKKNDNLIGKVPEEFDALVERMTAFITDRLQAENDPTGRLRLFGFPAQMATLKQPVYDFLAAIFEPTRYHANATLRGFYFTSGTQQGTPIDRIIGSLSRAFNAEATGESFMSGTGRSYFLQDLLKKVIFAESAWVSTDRSAVRRRWVLLSIGYLLLIAATGVGVAAWTTSYAKNNALIEGTNLSVADYKKLAGPLLDETLVADRKFERVVPLLEALRGMPTGYAHRADETPLVETFGLAQRPRLTSASQTAYRAALERFLRPRILYRLEEVIDQAMSENTARADRNGLYEAFKVYLMLGAQGPVEKGLIIDWVRNDWAKELYPGPEREGFRKALEEHLVAMLDLDTGTGLPVQLNGNLVRDVQQVLVRMNLAERAYNILRSRARASKLKDWVLGKVGTDMATVFEANDRRGLDSIVVPSFYTYDGFYEGLIDKLPGIAEQLDRDRWVLGEAGQQGVVADQFDRLPDDILAMYAKDFMAAWDGALARLAIKPLTADKPRYLTLASISAAASPLKQIFEEIKTQTQLSRERKKPEGAAADANKDKPAVAPGGRPPVVISSAGASRTIEDHFRPYYLMVDGGPGQRPVDQMVGTLNDIYQGLVGSATESGPGAQINAATRESIRTMRASANRFPGPFDRLLRNASDEFENNVAVSVISDLQKALAESVTPVCKQVVTGRYPFSKGASQEVALLDFGKVFGPNGVMDRFQTNNLAQYIDTSKAEWTWKKDSKIGQSLTQASLREFQRASQIREAFFANGPQPGFQMAITALTANAAGTTVKLDIAGTQVVSPQLPAPPNPGLIPGLSPPPPPPPQNQRGGAPVQVAWPGPVGMSNVKITAVSDTTGEIYQIYEKNGTWALFRVIDTARVQRFPDRLVVTITSIGRDFQYQINVASLVNPLTLPALREFNCPTTLQ